MAAAAAAGPFTGVAAAEPVSAAQAQYTTVPPLKTGGGVKRSSPQGLEIVADATRQGGRTPVYGTFACGTNRVRAPTMFAGLALRRKFRVRPPRP